MGNEYVPIVDKIQERPSTFDFTTDSEILRGYGKEFSDRFLQNLEYFPLKYPESSPANIYGEQDSEGIDYDNPVRIRANAVVDLSKRKLEGWGIKEDRDIAFFVAIQILEEVNISPKMGDQFRWENIFYQLCEAQVDKREQASLRPLSVRFLCIRTPITDTGISE